METLSKIEQLRLTYQLTVNEAENAISSAPETLIPKAARFASTIAMVDTFKKVIKDLDTLLLP